MADKKASGYLGSIVDSYTDTSKQFTFASDSASISTKENDPKWMLQNLKAMFALYVRNQCGIGYTGITDMQNNRAYAAGAQTIQKYKNQLMDDPSGNGNVGDTIGGNGHDRRGLLNINWEVVSELPKLKRIVIAMAESTKYDVEVNAIDVNAGIERERIKFDAIMRNLLSAVYKEAEISMQTGQPGDMFSGSTIEEIEFAAKTGNLKLQTEIAIQNFLKASFEESGWDTDILDKLVGDIFENNKAACKDYIDPQTGRVKQRYVDITRLIIQYNRTNNYKDSMFAGELRQITIREARSMTNLSEEELIAMAIQYNGIAGNTIDNAVSINGYWDAQKQNFLYDEFLVWVLDGEMISNDEIRFTKKTDKSGTERFYREVKTTNGNIISKPARLYKGTWIVGTEFVYDFGPANYIVRDNQRPRLSYHVFIQDGPSIVQTLIPLADMYCLNWYKLQNAIAMAPPAGLAIEFKSLQNVMLGGKKLSPQEIIRMRTQTGYMPFSQTNIFGKVTSAGFPFQEMGGGVGAAFNEFIQMFNQFERISQRISGFTDIASAVTPKAESGLGVNELSWQSASNALQAMFKGAMYLKKSVAENCAKRIQLIARYKDEGYSAYTNTIGAYNMLALNITSDKSLHELGIFISTTPASELKQNVVQGALEAMRAGKNGSPGIDMADYLQILQAVDQNNIKYAQALLTFKIKKAEERAEQMQRENMMLNGKNMQEQEMLKAKAAQEEMKAKYDYELRNNVVAETLKQHAELAAEERSLVQTIVQNTINYFNEEAQAKQAAKQEALAGIEQQILGQGQENMPAA